MAELSYDEWLERDPKNRELVKLLEGNRGAPLTPEFKEYLVDSALRTGQQFLATRKWLAILQDLCHRIDLGVAPNAECVLFWIYLYGVTHELFEKEQKTRAVMMQIPWRRPFLEALDELHNSFDIGELSFIRYMRHNHVHILVDYPWKRLVVKGDGVEQLREAPDPTAIANAKRILLRYDNSQQTAVKDFVKKSSLAIDRLFAGFREAVGE